MAAGQQAYYLSAVADGIEDYYSVRGEAPGRWLGGLSSELDLEGSVEAEDLHAVLAGIDPSSGSALGRRRKVPGFDLTFSAPKSVSLLYALGSREVRAEVVDAHEAAVEAAIGYLEREACRARSGAGGTVSLSGEGFVAAAFRHRTSRAGDPHLHTHVLVANSTRSTDGAWRSLDARFLYLHQRTAGFLYQAQLRAELTRRVGVEWSPARRGMAEIEGVPRVVLRAFSRRRQEVETRLAELGLSSATAAEAATLETRRSKDYGVSGESLFATWRARAAELGFSSRHVAGLLHSGRSPRPPRLVPRTLGETLTENVSYFDRRDVLRAIAELARDGLDVDGIEQRTDRFLSTDAVTPLSSALIGMRYSTPELLRIEETLVSGAVRHRNDGLGVVNPATLGTHLAARPALAAEQRAMVTNLTTSGAALEVVMGVAGSGKTFALDAARAAWQAAGHRVLGTAVAARAAAELQAGSGIPSFTVEALLRHLDRHPSAGLARRTVVVVDEAGMLGTRKLARLVAHARRARAKVVLVGDVRQLPEIEAGGAFGHLARRLGGSWLPTNRRQRDPVERLAVAALRAGRIDSALEALSDHGRLVTADNSEDVRNAMVADWARARAAGADAVMLAVRRSDVDDLNKRALALLTPELGAPTPVGGHVFCIGERVVALHNDRRLGVLNGTRAAVTRIDGDGVDLATDGGVRLHIPRDYIDQGWLATGYATTLHKAQGLTCDEAFLLGDERLYLEAGYTGLTRARQANRLYSVAADEEECGDVNLDPTFALARALGKSRAQVLGLELRADGVGVS